MLQDYKVLVRPSERFINLFTVRFIGKSGGEFRVFILSAGLGNNCSLRSENLRIIRQIN